MSIGILEQFTVTALERKGALVLGRTGEVSKSPNNPTC